MNVEETKNVDAFLESISKERVLYLNFKYLASFIDGWWIDRKSSCTHDLKNQLISIFNQMLHEEDRQFFNRVGLAEHNIAAIHIEDIFSIDSPSLALAIHEALSDMFCLVDIKYEYEEHKALYLKPSAKVYNDWGLGSGDISPHSDDLYENLSVDYLSLTVCRDRTNTPTLAYKPIDIIGSMSKSDIHKLMNTSATFFSGKNVTGNISRINRLVDFSEKYGYQFCLDFRIDENNKRMIPTTDDASDLLENMRVLVASARKIELPTKTGSFTIIANKKFLHARSQLNSEIPSIVKNYSTSIDYESVPRLLFRSKGQRRNYLNLTPTTSKTP